MTMTARDEKLKNKNHWPYLSHLRAHSDRIIAKGPDREKLIRQPIELPPEK